MDTKALEIFCPWARLELIEAVDMRCKQYALDDTGRHAYPAGSDIISGIVGGRTLSAAEKAQRDTLFERIEQVGYTAFCEQQAYRWFNRFAAIRYMEIHGFLPSGVRMLSNADEAFSPDCLRAADGLELPGLDAQTIFDLTMAGNDEELYRHIIVAQMNELAACLPTIFGPVSSADALTLPNNLLMRNDHNVLLRLVEDIPRPCWQNVEVLGWMYQFYNAELKDAFFKSKRKATVADLAPATQLFTPDWIVRYMVENSLGRLWMLNNPGSDLREHMAYYIEPDAEHEDFIRIDSPEDITFCDPACGSGHILVCAFDLLVKMYLERGYREREIPELILTKNLAGLEIDERAAQFASLQLAMVAREQDRRLFGRGVEADIQVLESVPLDEDNLLRTLVGKKDLVEALGHLSELGSLYTPDAADLAAIDTAISELSGASLFGAAALEQLKRAKTQIEALSRSFDVVVANPPYMGGSSFNPFMSKWMKKHYPDTCKDLCTAFIERGYSLARKQGYATMVTMQSWMFLGSFEKMRGNLLDNKGIVTMAHLGPRAFDAIGGEVVSVTADVIYNSQFAGKGTYFRLVDIIGSEPKRAALVEAIQNPDCSWFYRADANTFHDIPGSPIAYWASDAIHEAFALLPRVSDFSEPRVGMATANNDRFMRMWHEVSVSNTCLHASSRKEALESESTWFPFAKGGEMRKWYGNNDYLVNWHNDGEEIRNYKDEKTGRIRSHNYNLDYIFNEAITWTVLSSGRTSFRYCPQGFLYSNSGYGMFFSDSSLLFEALGFMNGSIVSVYLKILSPGLGVESGYLRSIPYQPSNNPSIRELVELCIQLSKTDWDTQETSWDFKRNPLI